MPLLRFCLADSICERARIRTRLITVLPEGRQYQCHAGVRRSLLKYLQPRFLIPAPSGLHAIRFQDYRLCFCLQPTRGLVAESSYFSGPTSRSRAMRVTVP
jgi:hypothetical protein